MFTVRFYLFQCCAASLLKVEPQAYKIAGAFFRVAGEMRRLPAYFDYPVKMHGSEEFLLRFLKVKKI